MGGIPGGVEGGIMDSRIHGSQVGTAEQTRTHARCTDLDQTTTDRRADVAVGSAAMCTRGSNDLSLTSHVSPLLLLGRGDESSEHEESG